MCLEMVLHTVCAANYFRCHNATTLIDAIKEVCLEINVEKTKHMLLSRHQNVGQNRDIKIANRSFENL
jgi:hypothetical protein